MLSAAAAVFAARRRYAKRRRELRVALGRALAARAGTLGAGQIEFEPERIATAIMALSIGLAQQALVDPRAVPMTCSVTRSS